MDRKRWVWLVLVVFGLAVAGCERVSQQDDEAPDIAMTLQVTPDPPLFGRPCEMVITLQDSGGAPIENAKLSIKGDMTHAGMVPVLAEAAGGLNGEYQTSFEWSMGGDWIVTVTAELPDGRTARRTFEVSVGIPGD